LLITLSFHRQKRAEEPLCEKVVSNTSNDDNSEIDDNDESGGLSSTGGNGENNASNYDCDESGGGNSNAIPLGALQVVVAKAPAERRAINPQDHIKEHINPTRQIPLLPVSVCGANVRL